MERPSRRHSRRHTSKFFRAFLSVELLEERTGPTGLSRSAGPLSPEQVLPAIAPVASAHPRPW